MYLKWKGAKCFVRGFCMCFSFWKIFIEFCLIHLDGVFEVYLGR